MYADRQREWTWSDTGRIEPVLRAVNQLGFITRYDRRRLDPERLVTQAVEETGLEDFGDPHWREGLQRACAAYSGEADLNALGYWSARQFLLQQLRNRLRLIEWVKRNPQIREQVIRRPWIVIGLPRSGTTLTSALLDLDDHVRSPLVWEGEHPVPPATIESRHSDPRIDQVRRKLRQWYAMSPAIPAIHYMEADAPHECIMMTALDFRGLLFQSLALTPSYGRWHVDCDMSSAFEIHKLVLKTWQHEISTRHWGLKAPSHLHQMEYVMAAYPDARVIWVHRDPVSCIPSISSLISAATRPLTHRPDPAASGEHMRWMWHRGVEKAMSYDAQRVDPRWCFHLHYHDLVRDPVAALGAAYAHFGDHMETEHIERIVAWLRQRPQHAFGRHRYPLEAFSLSASELREQFAHYVTRYSVAADS